MTLRSGFGGFSSESYASRCAKSPHPSCFEDAGEAAPIADTKFCVGAVEVAFDRTGRHSEAFANCFRGQAVGGENGDFTLARGEWERSVEFANSWTARAVA